MASLDDRPVRSLIVAFVAWKALLLLIAAGSSVSAPYDTSTSLLSPLSGSFNESVFDLPTRLTRWDAIYFVQVARRGYHFEQEWAFGSGLPALIALFAKGLRSIGLGGCRPLEPLIGVSVAHASHLLSVLVLHRLGLKVLREPKLSFVAALLHVLSPAGLFLSAPYAESTFALLSFAGYLLFSQGLGPASTAAGDAAIVGSGVLHGLATVFRSNGLLNGVPFAVFALLEAGKFVKSPKPAILRRLIALGFGGLFVASGYIGPQVMAYQTFCSNSSAADPRVWCTQRLPGIYTFVQERYWNVGFLRYWVLPNIPLFLLATPMIYVMLRSGLQVLSTPLHGSEKSQSPTPIPTDVSGLVWAMALSQVILSLLAITSYHVQIITRLASGYPIWYWWLARILGHGKTSSLGGKVVVFMIMYATIQGALFASFLPPA